MVTVGIALLLAGVILAVAEAHAPTAGILGGIGTAAAVAGTALAIDGAGGGVVLAVVIAVLVALVFGGFLAVALSKVARPSQRRVRSRSEAMIERHGRARTAVGAGEDQGEGRVLVEGVLWRARPSLDDEPFEVGDEIVVERLDGLTLTVRKAEPWELSP